MLRYDHPGHGLGSPRPRLVGRGAGARRARDPRRARDRARLVLRPVARRRRRACGSRCNAPERIDRLVLACTSARFGTPENWLRAHRHGPRRRRRGGRRRRARDLVHAARPAATAPGARARLPRDDGLGRARGLRGLLRGARRAGIPGDALAGDPRADARDRRQRGRRPRRPRRARRSSGASPVRAHERPRRAPGHLANLEQPDAFTRLLLDHLTARPAMEVA